MDNIFKMNWWMRLYNRYALSVTMSRDVRKSSFWHVLPTMTQINLHICAVWSEFLLSAWGNFVSFPIQNASSDDSDQTARMRMLIWFFSGRKCPKVRFLTFRIKCMYSYMYNLTFFQQLIIICNTGYSNGPKGAVWQYQPIFDQLSVLTSTNKFMSLSIQS